MRPAIALWITLGGAALLALAYFASDLARGREQAQAEATLTPGTMLPQRSTLPAITPSSDPSTASDEAGAVQAMHDLFVAERVYSSKGTYRGYACSLDELLADRSLPRAAARAHGYNLDIVNCTGQGAIHTAYLARALPVISGRRAFCMDDAGGMRAGPICTQL